MHGKVIGTSLPRMRSQWRHPAHSVAAVVVHYWVLSLAYSIFIVMASETPCVSPATLEVQLPYIVQKPNNNWYLK